jgi:hypothetical protein
MPLVQEHFPALQRAPARMAPKAAPIQEIAAAITNRLFIDAGISCIDEEIRVIDAGPALHRCNSFLRRCSFLGQRCSFFLQRSRMIPGLRSASSGLRRFPGRRSNFFLQRFSFHAYRWRFFLRI